MDIAVTMHPPGKILKNATIVIKDGKVIKISKENTTRVVEGEVIDGKGKIALPGFVDAHAHSTQSLFRGLLDELPLFPWLTRLRLLMRYTDEKILRAGITVSLIERIQNGITTVIDMERCIDTVVNVAKALGIRLRACYLMFDRHEVPYSTLHTETEVSSEIKMAEKYFKRYDQGSEGLIGIWFAPVGYPASSPDLLKESAIRAREIGARLHTHVAEGYATLLLVKREIGLSEVGLLESIGFLGPDALLAHCIQIDENDIYLISKYSCSIAHCPSSNMKLGNGIAPVLDMLKQRVNVCIGLDGAASNNSSCILHEAKIASLVQKGLHREATTFTALDSLKMITLNPAKALGLVGKLGCIKEGALGDVVLIKKRANLFPSRFIVSHIIYAPEVEISDVIIQGRIIMRDRKLQTIDEEKALEEAEKEFNRFLDRLPSELYGLCLMS